MLLPSSLVSAATVAALDGAPLDVDFAALPIPPQLAALAREVARREPGAAIRILAALAEAEPASLEMVWRSALARILREVALPAVTEDRWGIRAAVEQVAAALISGEGIAAAHDAARAARAAAHAAADAAWGADAAAARAAGAAAAAHAAAADAARAARAAAHAAAAAAYAAAWAAYAAAAAAARAAAAWAQIANILVAEIKAA